MRLTYRPATIVVISMLAACVSSDADSTSSEGTTEAATDAVDTSSAATTVADDDGGATTVGPSSDASSGGAVDSSGGADTVDETTGGDEPDGQPLYDVALDYSGDLPVLGDPTDVYWPDATGPFPVVVLLQGADVDKEFYSGVAGLVARYGFVVVVPNHETTGFMGTGLFSEQSVIVDALAGVAALGDDTDSPLSGQVDTSLAGIMGHSYGGVVGVSALSGQCMFPFCTPPFDLPAAVKAGAFYGTNMRGPLSPQIPAVANDGHGIALIQGTLDGKAAPADGLGTFEALQTPPGAYVSLLGANHYGVNDVDDPPGAAADASAPTIDQAVAVETVGRWSGNFLRAWVLDDADAAAYIEGPSGDTNVVVMLK